MVGAYQMSWWGTHPQLSREQALKLLRAAGRHGCSVCTYAVQVRGHADSWCSRCSPGAPSVRARVSDMYGGAGYNQWAKDGRFERYPEQGGEW
jgi:hypothetical protein